MDGKVVKVFENIVKIDFNKKIYVCFILELIMCFMFDAKFNTSLFLIAIIFDIAVLLSIFIFNSDSAIIAMTLISSFTLTYMAENLGFPEYIKYIQDCFILMMAVKLIMFCIRRDTKIYNIYHILFLFISFSILSCIFNKCSIFLYIRTLYFDYIRYFIIGIFLINSTISEEKIIKYIKILWYTLLFQIPLVIIQYFWSLNNWKAKNPGDIRQDYLSGIIGGRGTTELGLLITIALSILFVLYIFNKVKFISFLISTLLLVTISILAEVKFILILLPLMFLTMTLKKLNLKSICIFALILLIMGIGSVQLVKIYPEFKNFFNTQSIKKYSKDSYASSGIGRSNSFIIANDLLMNNPSNAMMGYGIGTADTISPKYRFSAFNVSQYMIECGYMGVLCIYGMYIYVICISLKLIKYGRRDFERILGYSGIISIEVMIIATFYNRSMVKINFAVLAWMIIGLIYKYYCLNKEERRIMIIKDGSVAGEFEKAINKHSSTCVQQ